MSGCTGRLMPNRLSHKRERPSDDRATIASRRGSEGEEEEGEEEHEWTCGLTAMRAVANYCAGDETPWLWLLHGALDIGCGRYSCGGYMRLSALFWLHEAVGTAVAAAAAVGTDVTAAAAMAAYSRWNYRGGYCCCVNPLAFLRLLLMLLMLLPRTSVGIPVTEAAPPT